MTPLDKTLKRGLNINGRGYVITIDPQALKITEKGRRIGLELKWADIVSGESALAVALHASLGKFQQEPTVLARKTTETPTKPGPRTKASIRPRRSAKKRASKRS
jgi:hypothetical protein